MTDERILSIARECLAGRYTATTSEQAMAKALLEFAARLDEYKFCRKEARGTMITRSLA